MGRKANGRIWKWELRWMVAFNDFELYWITFYSLRFFWTLRVYSNKSVFPHLICVDRECSAVGLLVGPQGNPIFSSKFFIIADRRDGFHQIRASALTTALWIRGELEKFKKEGALNSASLWAAVPSWIHLRWRIRDGMLRRATSSSRRLTREKL